VARNLSDGGAASLRKRMGTLLPRSAAGDRDAVDGAEPERSGSVSIRDGSAGPARPGAEIRAATRDGPSIRSVVRISLAVAGTALALYLLYLIRSVLQLMVLSLFLALALGPLVEFLIRRRFSRTAAIGSAYLTLFALLVFLGLVAIPPVAREIDAGARQLPSAIVKLDKNATFRKYDKKYKITPKLQAEARKLPGQLASIAKKLSAVTVGAFTAITKLITVLALGFFILRDGPRLANPLYRIRGPDQEERLRRLGNDMYRSVSGYVAGNVAISVIAGLVAYTSLKLLGVGFAAPLAVLVGVFDLLPLVGATIAAIIVGIVTLFYSFPTDTIIWAIVVLVYQQVENNVLSPIVYRRTVQVPGMLVLIAVLIGATLDGVIGALLAIPVAAAIQILVRDAREQRRARIDQAAAEPRLSGSG
jgi:predicted PurR-regulated permease PerM